MIYGRKQIEKLIDRAVEAHDPKESVQFTQSALNAAHALATLQNVEVNDANINRSNA